MIQDPLKLFQQMNWILSNRQEGHTIRPATTNVYTPLIDMKPSDPDTMLTAMVEANRLTNETGHTLLF